MGGLVNRGQLSEFTFGMLGFVQAACKYMYEGW